MTTPGPKKTLGSIRTSRPTTVSWLNQTVSGASSVAPPSMALSRARRWNTASAAASCALELTPRASSAGQMTDALATGAWDVAFLAREAGRAGEVGFTAPHLLIEGTYLVPAGSADTRAADLDRAGLRIAVSEKSAYELYLTRTIKHAKLLRTAGIDASFNLFVSDKLEALAGRFGLDVVALTLGAAGSRLYRAGRWAAERGRTVSVIDAVGAGDSYTAALVMGLLLGWPTAALLTSATDIAAFVCTRAGATPELPVQLTAPFAGSLA